MVSFIYNRLSWFVPCRVGLVVLVAGCGGGSGGGDGSTFAQGVFLDSPVQGLRYVVGSLEDFTDENGGFQYLPGRSISFYIGDILLGSAQGAPVLTPLAIVPGGANSVTDNRVTNIIRFLQTIDDDYDPSNGIRIDDSAHEALLDQSLSFNMLTADFANDSNVQFLLSLATASPGPPRDRLVPAITAQAHMRATLEDLQTPGRTPPVSVGSIDVTGQVLFGPELTPDPILSFANVTTGFSIIEWHQPLPSLPNPDAGVRLDIRFNANPFTNNQIELITLTWEHQVLGIRSFGVACSGGSAVFLSAIGCPDVTIDLDNGTVDFDGRLLSAAENINSTISLTGTLIIP